MNKKITLVGIGLFVFIISVTMLTSKNSNESAKDKEQKIYSVSSLEYEDEMDDYIDNVWRSTVKDKFESLFGISMKGFEYKEINEAFSANIASESVQLNGEDS